MRALVVTEPGRVDLVERSAPEPPAGGTLVRPELVGLCGTDVEIIDGKIDPAYVRYPLVLGHEWTGRSEDGSRVVAEGIVPCGHCPRCRAGETNLCETYDEIGFTRDGAAADAIVVPSSLVHGIGGHVDIADAALVEPCAVVHRALLRAAPPAGARVLVVGDGTVALLTAHLVGAFAPAEVTMLGRRPAQEELALRMGAGRFVVDDAAAGSGYDVVVEAAGETAAALAAIGAARRGGVVVLLGLPPHGETGPVAFDGLVNDDLTILASFSYTSAAWAEVVALVNEGTIHPGRVVTHRFALEEWPAAIDTLRTATGPRGKVVLTI